MKKIRINGKVCHKFDIAYLIDKVAPYRHISVIYEEYTYSQLCEKLYNVLKRCERYDILNHIEWFGNIAPF